jgi:hypothetical protein
LREERSQDNQQKALSVARCLDEDTPAILLVQLLQLNSLANFCEFGFDKVVLGIAAGMELRALC